MVKQSSISIKGNICFYHIPPATDGISSSKLANQKPHTSSQLLLFLPQQIKTAKVQNSWLIFLLPEFHFNPFFLNQINVYFEVDLFFSLLKVTTPFKYTLTYITDSPQPIYFSFFLKSIHYNFLINQSINFMMQFHSSGISSPPPPSLPQITDFL